MLANSHVIVHSLGMTYFILVCTVYVARVGFLVIYGHGIQTLDLYGDQSVLGFCFLEKQS